MIGRCPPGSCGSRPPSGRSTWSPSRCGDGDPDPPPRPRPGSSPYPPAAQASARHRPPARPARRPRRPRPPPPLRPPAARGPASPAPPCRWCCRARGRSTAGGGAGRGDARRGGRARPRRRRARRRGARCSCSSEAVRPEVLLGPSAPTPPSSCSARGAVADAWRLGRRPPRGARAGLLGGAARAGRRAARPGRLVPGERPTTPSRTVFADDDPRRA